MQTVSDVLVGDVWLCSGQSNMVLQVHRALDSRSEIANSANDAIRLLTVPQASSAAPSAIVLAGRCTWQVAGPATVPEFSAACFYFARELQKTVDVPMGLIVAAWGGSRIQTWMSEAALRAAGGNDDALDVLALYAEQPAAAHARWGAMWEAWWLQSHARAPRSGAVGRQASRASGAAAPRALGPWEQWGVPELAELQRHGVVSHERDVVRPAGAAAGDAVIGPRRRDGSDVDQRPADRQRGWSIARRIPRR